MLLSLSGNVICFFSCCCQQSKIYWHHTLYLFVSNIVHRHSVSDSNRCWVCFLFPKWFFLKKNKNAISTWKREQRPHIAVSLWFTLRSARLAGAWPHPERLTSTRCEDRICRCVCALIIWSAEKSDIWGIWQNHETVQMPNFSFPLRLTTDCVCMFVCSFFCFFLQGTLWCRITLSLSKCKLNDWKIIWEILIKRPKRLQSKWRNRRCITVGLLVHPDHHIKVKLRIYDHNNLV